MHLHHNYLHSWWCFVMQVQCLKEGVTSYIFYAIFTNTVHEKLKCFPAIILRSKYNWSIAKFIFNM